MSNFVKRIVRDFPILRIYIEIPFFSVRTHLMGYSYAENTYEYVAVEIKLHKWTWHFMLYKNRVWK